MEWTRQIDGYCERLDASFWAEPINALTNGAFLIAAIILWERSRRQAVKGLAPCLCIILAAIGIGSFLFHTFATIWAALADVLPIVGFVFVYIFAVNRDIWGLRGWRLWGATALFFPYAAALIPLFSRVPGLGSSASYAPVPLLILIYAVMLRRRFPVLARDFLVGAAILVCSILFRSLDLPLCDGLHSDGHSPLGTHFLWHCLNGLMLGWMIEAYLRQINHNALRGKGDLSPVPRAF